MKQRLEEIKLSAVDAVKNSSTLPEIEEIRVKYLGKKGELTAILKQMGSLSPEERPIMGQLVNKAKAEVEKLEEELSKLEGSIQKVLFLKRYHQFRGRL